MPAAICRSSVNCFSSFRADRNAELRREMRDGALDGGHRLFVFLLKRGVEQLLEPVGDAGDGGVDDQHARASRATRALTTAAMFLPVGDRGDAGAAELEDDPR